MLVNKECPEDCVKPDCSCDTEGNPSIWTTKSKNFFTTFNKELLKSLVETGGGLKNIPEDTKKIAYNRLATCITEKMCEEYSVPKNLFDVLSNKDPIKYFEILTSYLETCGEEIKNTIQTDENVDIQEISESVNNNDTETIEQEVNVVAAAMTGNDSSNNTDTSKKSFNTIIIVIVVLLLLAGGLYLAKQRGMF